MDMNKDHTVLVTEGTGFVGVHCILQLLQKGYKVRTTIRSINRKNEVIEMLKAGGINTFDNLEFAEADLTADTNWTNAVKNSDYVLHVASTIGAAVPKDENEMIRSAVEATIRLLKAAENASVKRVVMTSNFGAVGYSHKDKVRVITEENWTDFNEKGLSAYNKSKILAERAAWDFIKNDGRNLELSVINPMAIFGPSLGQDLPSELDLLKKLLDGSMKAVPNITLGIVDVRDLADLHIQAMTNPAAKGQRFLALSGKITTLPEIAVLLKKNLGDRANKVSTKQIPDWIVRCASLFSPIAKNVVPQLSRYRNASNEKAKILLGWQPRSNEEAILASVESLFRFAVL